jgi:hypothetical protein
VGVLYPTS